MPSAVAIIGNGFDLNLGMRTSYQDFFESSYFPEGNDASLACALRRKKDALGWVDIEQELADFSKSNPQSGTFKAEYQALRSALAEYIRSLPLPAEKGETHAHRLIEVLAKESDLLIVNFNYTRSVKHLLATAGRKIETLDKEHWSIHGTCDDDSIIFGVDDSAQICNDHHFLFKSFAKNYSARGLVEKLKSAHAVHIFGHSLGPPDHMYFRDYFLNLAVHSTKSKLILYHHGEQGRLNLLSQIRTMVGSKVSAVRNNVIFELEDVSV